VAPNAENLLRQSLEEERLQAMLLKNQISILEQKLATLHKDSRSPPLPVMMDACMQTIDVSRSEVKAHEAEVMYIIMSACSI